MPKVVVSRTTLLAAIDVIEVWLAPPVPAVIWMIPFVGSATPDGLWAAKRS
jgi:hypothetical protein